MGRLIHAEFRKVLTSNLWWALLIPTVLVALLWAWIWAGLGTSFADALSNDPQFQQLNVPLGNLPLAGIGLGRAINISTVFPMLLGGFALSSEIRNRTITTTYLTASSRVQVLGAKLVVYAGLGVVYGLLIGGVASLGIVLGTPSHHSLLPDAGNWLGIVGGGVLESLIWTLLAVGVGALFGNVIGTLLTLILYSVIAENLITLRIPGHGPGFFPNQAGDGITAAISSQAILDKLPPVPADVQQDLVAVIQTIAGARGVFDWWLNALIFATYMVIFFGLGWLVSQKRDIT